MMKDCVIVALVAVILYLGAFLVYGQRYSKENTLFYMESRVAELDRVEALWKEAIKRCLAD